MKHILLLLLLASPVLAQNQYWGARPSVPYPESLLAMWNFDEGAGSTAIDSMGSYNLTTVGSALWKNSITGFTKACSLNGTNNFYAKRGFNRTNSTGIFCCWLLRPVTSVEHTIFACGDTLAGSGSTVLFEVGTNDSLYIGAARCLYGKLDDANTWYHVAVICSSGTNHYFMVNGKRYGKVGTAVLGWFDDITAKIFSIGTRQTTGPTFSYMFKGLIDQVLLYKTSSLPGGAEATVKRIYAQGKTLHLQGTKATTVAAKKDTIRTGKRGVALTNNITLSAISGDSLWPVKDSLIAHWRFNNNGVDEVGGYTAVLSGGATYKTSMKGFAQACTLDGVNDSVTVADNNVFTFSNGSGTDYAFSISFWAYMVDATNFYAVQKWGASNTTREFTFRVGSTDLLAFLCFGQSGGTRYIGRTAKNMTAFENTWVYIVGTYSGSKSASGIKIYRNAVQIDSIDANSGTYTGMSNVVTPLTIGYDASNVFTKGSIDAVRIYRRELTAGEVRKIYDKSRYGYESR